MKWLFLLFMIGILLVILLSRFRPQVENLLYLWRVLKKMNRSAKEENPKLENKSRPNEIRLVKCSGCGCWVPREKTLSFGRDSLFCSAECVENSVRLG